MDQPGRMNTKTRQFLAGFSLVEVMVSLGVIGILLLGVSGLSKVLTSRLGTLSETSNSLSAIVLPLETLKRDLRTATQATFRPSTDSNEVDTLELRYSYHDVATDRVVRDQTVSYRLQASTCRNGKKEVPCKTLVRTSTHGAELRFPELMDVKWCLDSTPLPAGGCPSFPVIASSGNRRMLAEFSFLSGTGGLRKVKMVVDLENMPVDSSAGPRRNPLQLRAF